MTRALPWLILLLGILQPLSGALAPAFGIGTPIGDASASTNAPEQPLPAFFSIWGLIFLAYAGFGLAGILRPAAWYPKVAWPMLAAGLANVIWMLIAQQIVSQPLNFLLLAPIFISAWIASAQVEALRPSETGFTLKVADAASGLLAGWISLATAISVPLTIRTFTGLAPTDFPWPMFSITFAVASVASWLFAARVSRSLWFFAALGWGFLGVVLNNWLRTDMHLIAGMAALGTATILFLRVTRPPKRLKSAA